MKKLMFAALGAAVTTGAFAAPLVYDYKASAKHMYSKEVNVRVGNETVRVYQKYVKSASLKGYLIVDTDGATSQALIADRADGNSNPGTAVDYGRSRAYLVVMNTKAEKSVRTPKLIPAALDAKWIDTRINANGDRSRTGLAEGYLYAGGDFGVATRTKLDLLTAGVGSRGAVLPGQVMIGDYAWQSIWLFGEHNMPLVAADALTLGFWDVVQGAIDTGADGANLPLTNGFAANEPFFHDAWFNGSGFGKYQLLTAGKLCCGLELGNALVLQSLSGNMKGGLFLCTENGIALDGAAGYRRIANIDWEDQFFCARLRPAVDFGVDIDQTDLWHDGQLEMNTTDCISGTWSIKRTEKLAPVAMTLEELNLLGGTAYTVITEDSTGLVDLIATIKGAAQRLDRNSVFASNKNIFDYTVRELGRHERVPVLTPAFAQFYGFLNFK